LLVCVRRSPFLKLKALTVARGVNPAGDRGDTSPQNVERGTVIRHVPPPQIWRIYASVSAAWPVITFLFLSSTVSDVSMQPVLRVRSLDPKAVSHRPPQKKFPTRYTPLTVAESIITHCCYELLQRPITRSEKKCCLKSNRHLFVTSLAECLLVRVAVCRTNKSLNGVSDEPLHILKTSRKSALFLLCSRDHSICIDYVHIADLQSELS